jgi:hypothetical protein
VRGAACRVADNSIACYPGLRLPTLLIDSRLGVEIKFPFDQVITDSHCNGNQMQIHELLVWGNTPSCQNRCLNDCSGVEQGTCTPYAADGEVDGKLSEGLMTFSCPTSRFSLSPYVLVGFPSCVCCLLRVALQGTLDKSNT